MKCDNVMKHVCASCPTEILGVLLFCRNSADIGKRKSYAGSETTPHINKGKGATLVPSTVKLLHHKKEKSMGIKRFAGLADESLIQ